MKKLNFITLLLLAGCASAMSSLDLVSFNQKMRFQIPQNVNKVNSCEALKETSYDVFYSDDNPKCLKKHIKSMEDAGAKVDQAKTDAEKLSLLKSIVFAYEKVASCKATSDLTLAELSNYEDHSVDYRTVIYYDGAYNICSKS